MRVFNKIQKQKYGKSKRIHVSKRLLENSSSPKSDYKEFHSWFQEFIEREKGYRPENIHSWFKSVEENHNELRKLIGGVRKHFIVRMEDTQSPADIIACKPYIDSIRDNMSTYIDGVHVKYSDMLNANMPTGIKTSKHIMQYAANLSKIGLLKPECRKNVEKAVAKLGEQWAKAKTHKQEITVTISTAPKAFALIGHYGPDDCSCFRQGNTNAQHKFNLAVLSNTFVALFREGNIIVDEPKDSKNVRARMWGFYNPMDEVINFCNFYRQGQFPNGNALSALKEVCGTLFDTSADEIKCTDNIIRIDQSCKVYHNVNSEQNWSLCSKDKKYIDQQILASNHGEVASIYYVQAPRDYEDHDYYGDDWNDD